VRAVLDTNVVISALVFRRGPTATLRQDWMAERFTPISDRPCASELIRGLAYPKFRLGREEIHALLADYLPFCEVVAALARSKMELPVCSDPDDQKFIDLADRGQAEVLVTGDRALLDLAGRTRFAIEGPEEFLRRLEG